MHEIFKKNLYYLLYNITGKFIEPNKKERKLVYCKLCPKELKYCGNTTNLRNHLEGSHSAEFKLVQQYEKDKGKTSSS